METLKIPENYKNILRDFTQGLRDLYHEELVSVILYGSAASGEFVAQHSNINVLVVLKNAELGSLKKTSGFLRKHRMLHVLFLTEGYIAASTDVFPIEFLDMQENYFLLYGKDIVKGSHIDLCNLRFQCEQELKAKLLGLRQGYVMIHNNPGALRALLFVSFNSILHVARNILRLKGKTPPYGKSDILSGLETEFKIDMRAWEKILAARNKRVQLSAKEIEPVFVDFVKGLELLVDIVDKL